MTPRRLAIVVLAAVFTLGAMLQAGQQLAPGEIRADAVVERAVAHAGTTIRAAVSVPSLGGLHVQAHHPIDRSSIPTTLTFKPPTGITVKELVFPKTVLFSVPGFDKPQPVYEKDLIIG